MSPTVSSVESGLPAAGGAPTAATEALAHRETFLKLLVAQIRNQNPLDPANPMEFVSELAQFSELEQVIQIRAELEDIRKALAGSSGGDQSTRGAN